MTYERLFKTSTHTVLDSDDEKDVLRKPLPIEVESLVLYNASQVIDFETLYNSCYEAKGYDTTHLEKLLRLTNDSIALKHVRLEFLCSQWWDLVYQQSLVVHYLSHAFPSACRIQVARWIEWRLDANEGRWAPVLYSDEEQGSGVESLQEFRCVLSSEQLDDKNTSAFEVRDHEGFLQGLG